MNRFYNPLANSNSGKLSSEESKHCLRILRHRVGDKILVMDGKGHLFHSVITDTSQSVCSYDVTRTIKIDKKPFSIHLAIAPTKNMDRMEWMVEKLTEIGVDRITFLTTKNSERRKLRLDRLEKKVVSAIKQSGNLFLPDLKDQTTLEELMDRHSQGIKFIAHVNHDHHYLGDILLPNQDVLLLIGPEGDFTDNEIAVATKQGFMPVSLGSTTLRTETAGLIACCMVNNINKY